MNNVLRMIPTDSTCIKAFGYRPSQKVLVVNFRNGDSLYEFYDFPYTKFLALCEVASVGTYFHEEIQGNYVSDKISD